jgi:integrase
VEGIALPEAAPEPLAKTSKREAVVSDGTIDADLIFLNAALNWATEYRVAGEPLLKSKPKVPRCKPQTGTLRQPVAAEDDLDALRPILDDVDPQGLLHYWMELVNQFGWRVTGLSHIKACELDFTARAHAPHGHLLKNSAVDKERRNDGVPLTARAAEILRELLAFRGLAVGDDAYLFLAPKGGGRKPWSRWHVGRLLVRAEAAAGIAHIGGLHAWRRKWHTERKNYPAQDVAVAAGYADPRSVDRYRHADAATTYLVVSTPTVVIRRAPRVEQAVENTAGAREPGALLAQGSLAASAAPTTTVATVAHANRQAVPAAARPRRALRRSRHKELMTPVTIADGVGQGRGSAARSVMPDGTVIDSRDERFAANLAVARAYAAEHDHLLPKKHERPDGVNLLMWLKNQEIRIDKGTMPPERRVELEAIAAWRERMAK